MRTRLFLYGTLLDAGTLARRGGVPGPRVRATPVELPGWRRVSLPGTPYPTLRRARGGSVRGALAVVSAAALARLAAYEGQRYDFRRVVVATPTGKSAAWTWIAAGAGTRPWKGGDNAATTPGPTRHARG
jgi:gamma-glutamylcyclotransferase (GGCT)/AIG2-like uncharacterized protein YtfP